MVDWNEIARVVTEHFQRTGRWVPYEEIVAAREPRVVWEGLDRLSHRYGHVWSREDLLVVSSWAGERWQASGAMQFPGGRDACQGYGVYRVELQAHGARAPNVFACVWPSDDVWDWEIDLVERDFEGRAYSTIHWGAASTGEDSYVTFPLEGVDVAERHLYELEWSHGLLVMRVDGVERWRTAERVPVDFSRGGTNGALGVGEQPAWAAHAQVGDAWVDVFAASYSVRD